MTKRDITLVAFGAVAGHWVIKLGLAYGVLAFFSAGVPEERIAKLEAIQAYLVTEMQEVFPNRTYKVSAEGSTYTTRYRCTPTYDPLGIPECTALQADYAKLEAQLKVLHQKRVQAQLGERER